MKLTIAHELLLLAHDEAGRLVVGKTALAAGLAGGLLCELAAQGRIDVHDGRVVVPDPSPLGSPCADSLLQDISTGSPRSVTQLIRRFDRLRSPLTGELVTAGVLSERKDKWLGVIPDRRNPVTDPAPADQVRARLAAALESPETADERTAGLARLVEVTGLSKRAFGDLSYTRRQHALRTLAKRPVQSDVERALREIGGAAAAVAVVAGGAD